MTRAAWRLALFAGLFVAWIGYLAYLVVATRNPVVLSRPQLLVSDFDVIARRTGPDTFAVTEVLYPPGQAEWKEKTITVVNIDRCQVFSPRYGGQPVPKDEGRGYLLPLREAPKVKGETGDDKGRFEVVPIPASPGYPAGFQPAGVGPPRIYPADEAVIRQYRTIPKP